jgi:uncharacterized membrane protein YbhN (UPF0104 family)
MKRAWPWLRAAGGLAILGVLVWRVGTGPFVAGLRVVGAWTVLVALAAGLTSTLACAWRWRRVAARLGVDLPLPESIAAYYRSQLLNVTMPFGVVGDVHRALRHGRRVGDLGRGSRSVLFDRGSGLLAQLSLAAGALLIVPTPLLPRHPSLMVALAAAAAAVVIGGILFARSLAVVVLVASGLALGANLALFVVAARATGTRAPMFVVVGLTLLALLASALPLSIAGWGPREGVAAWAFGSAGLGMDRGISASVAFGALTIVACLPGAGVLLVQWLRPKARWAG